MQDVKIAKYAHSIYTRVHANVQCVARMPFAVDKLISDVIPSDH